ncbi:hypothetical protein BFS14_15385 [Serratia fonticola]|uniref:fimbrial protein n=1 Tax=Serratia fonticola TaxID=47917 RepID=UPI0008FCFB9E|nr:fimbrial protein [Serratia fonticola]OIX95235.1 hypothetical protein BFS14_15385 [Serratia fonticola]QCR62976.1 type 1 fimbrial protein [Serratia fonticola]
MTLNKIMAVVALSFSLSSVAYAEEPVPDPVPAPVKLGGEGKIEFTGFIVDSPCSISPEAEEFTVPLGQVSKVALKNGGKSKARDFTISLENCEVGASDKNKVYYLFSGKDTEGSGGAGMLGITGATGAGVVITDGDGKPLTLGVMSDKPQRLVSGSNTLAFSAYLQGSGATAEEITEGEFRSTADFKLYYQ